MSILEEILAEKHREVAERSKGTSLGELESRMATAPAVRSFISALDRAIRPAIIAEVKKASPSRGVIRADFDPVMIAQTYEANGAACLSVLTDEKYFQGSLDYLISIRSACQIPILRKDFTVDRYQIAEARASGADAILLIVAALTLEELKDLKLYTEALGMTALVEVHSAVELESALEAGCTLIGINNRDLHTFITSLDTTRSLIATLPNGSIESGTLRIVSESGIFTRADIVAIRDAGCTAALVGESMMREADIGAKLRELIGID